MSRTLVTLVLLLTTPAIFAAAPKEPSRIVKIAHIQYPMQGSLKQSEFLNKVEAFIQEALKHQVDLILFPELFIFDLWPNSSKESESQIVRTLAKDFSPLLSKKLNEWSRKHKVHILAGSIPWLDDGKLYNVAVLSDPLGKEYQQKKTKLTVWERQMNFSPGESIEVWNLPIGRTVALICYDVEFPDVSMDLVKKQPELILVPSMTESLQGLYRVQWTAKARAVEHHAVVAISGTVGEMAKDWQHFSESMLITPQELALSGVTARAPQGEAKVLISAFDLELLRRNRAKADYFPAKELKR